jgi:hypothetical protein
VVAGERIVVDDDDGGRCWLLEVNESLRVSVEPPSAESISLLVSLLLK